jgi:hypothetical protein
MTEVERRKLEALLHARLKQDCTESEGIGYKPKKFKTMMAESGPVGACVRVIMSAKIPEGFLTLVELKREELTAESTVLHGPWKALFTEDVLKQAQKRLRDYNRPDLAI